MRGKHGVKTGLSGGARIVRLAGLTMGRRSFTARVGIAVCVALTVSLGLLGSLAVFGASAATASAGPAAAALSAASIGTVNARLVDPARTSGDDFGYQTAVSGDVAVVGAPERTDGDGAAYIYVKGANGWPTRPTVTLNDPAATAGDYFGFVVASSGETVVVGAPTSGGIGRAYIYSEVNGVWPTQPTVTLSDPIASDGDGFGQSLAVSGSTIAIGAFESDGANGAAYLYERGRHGWPTGPTLTLSPPSGSQAFGNAIAMTGTTIVVGAYFANTDSGAAYLFVKGPSGWPTTATSTLLDPAGASDDYFGDAVAVSSTTVVIAAEDTSTNTGAAYVYSEANGVWPSTPTTSLQAPAGSEHFGNSVATEGKQLIVTAVAGGKAGYVYREGSSGWPTTPSGTLPVAGSQPVVAMSGATVVAGEYGLDGTAGGADIITL